MAKKPLRIYSWNVNGIRAATGKGLAEWLKGCGGEIVGLQEVRAQPEQIPDEIRRLRRYHQHWRNENRVLTIKSRFLNGHHLSAL